MEERWKDIKGYKGHYRVSNTGKIMSLKSGRPKLLKIHLNQKGYPIIGLSMRTKKTYQIHQLVARAFIRNSHNKPQVNHKNGIKTDNRSSNLEWVTISENMKHAFAMGLAKITDKMKRDKGRLVLNLESGVFHDSILEAAETYDMHYQNLAMKLNGQRTNNTSLIKV